MGLAHGVYPQAWDRLQRVHSGALLFAAILRLGIYAMGQTHLLQLRLGGEPMVRVLWRLLQSLPLLCRAELLADGLSVGQCVAGSLPGTRGRGCRGANPL